MFDRNYFSSPAQDTFISDCDIVYPYPLRATPVRYFTIEQPYYLPFCVNDKIMFQVILSVSNTLFSPCSSGGGSVM